MRCLRRALAMNCRGISRGMSCHSRIGKYSNIVSGELSSTEWIYGFEHGVGVEGIEVGAYIGRRRGLGATVGSRGESEFSKQLLSEPPNGHRSLRCGQRSGTLKFSSFNALYNRIEIVLLPSRFIKPCGNSFKLG